MDDTTVRDAGASTRLPHEQYGAMDAQARTPGNDRPAGQFDMAALADILGTLCATREGLVELEQALGASARETMASANRYVRQHPWQCVGLGALAGVALGVLMGRR